MATLTYEELGRLIEIEDDDELQYAIDEYFLETVTEPIGDLINQYRRAQLYRVAEYIMTIGSYTKTPTESLTLMKDEYLRWCYVCGDEYIIKIDKWVNPVTYEPPTHTILCESKCESCNRVRIMNYKP